MFVARFTFLHTVALLAAMLSLHPQISRAESDCQPSWHFSNGILYLDPSPSSRFRVKGSEVALRLSGALDSNQNVFEVLEEGQGLRVNAFRRGVVRTSIGVKRHLVFSLVAAKTHGQLLWALSYNGDSANSDQKAIVLSNLSTAGAHPFTCEVLGSKAGEALDLSTLQIAALNFRERQIEVNSEAALAEQLGL